MSANTESKKSPTIVGILYPGHSAESDYQYIAKKFGNVRFAIAHTQIYTHDHTLAAAHSAGSEDMLIQGALQLADEDLSSVMWASTSGSFALGWEDAQQQAYGLYEIAAVSASSTSFAFINALHHLSVSSVAIVSHYPAELLDEFKNFLEYGKINVLGSVENEKLDSNNQALFDSVKLANKKYPDSEAIIVPSILLQTADILDKLEKQAGKPVLTANQVTAWYGLQLAGCKQTCKNLGKLFAK